jgi:hypothetical protein
VIPRYRLSIESAWTWRLWWLPCLALQACSEPEPFYFRGYSSQSDCRAIIDSELATGATFDDALTEVLEKGSGIVTELASEILGVPVAIDVACYGDGTVSYVDYVSMSDDVDSSSKTYETFGKSLDEIAGEVEEEQSRDIRSKTYLCDESGRIRLSQSRLSDSDYEVSLLVTPHPTDCGPP